MTTHIMLDIESLSLKTDAVILSIGACVFDPEITNFIGSQFYERVNPRTQRGRAMDVETIIWWMGQNAAAQNQAFGKEGVITLEEALSRLCIFFGQFDASKTVVWANGVTFDICVLEHALKQYNRPPPWKYSHVACMRTLRHLVPASVGESVPKVGTAHCALDDAIWQALYVAKALAHLKSHA